MILCNVEKITEVYYRSAETNNGKLLSSVLASVIKSIDHSVCKLLVGTYDGKVFWCRQKWSSPTFESHASTIKRQLRCCPS